MHKLFADLAEKLDGKKLKTVFGLEAQGHLSTIKSELEKWNDTEVDMTFSKEVWEHIGKKIGWDGFTAALSYFQIIKKENSSWKKIEQSKPICFKRGDWDGLKSDELICKTSIGGKFVGVAYEVDGVLEFYTMIDEYFFDNVVEWMDIPL